MHDIKAIRDDPQAFDRAWESRGLAPQAAELLRLDAELRRVLTEAQEAQAIRNDLSKRIGQAKAKKDEAEAQRLMAEVESFKAILGEGSAKEAVLRAQLDEKLAALPNVPDPDVPVGADEHGNVEVRRYGEPNTIANPKDHVDLGAGLGMMDFEAAARMSGSRFVVLKSQLARLERALGQYMIDLQTQEHGYTEVSPPLLVRDAAVYGVGQLPKFYDDLFTAARSSVRKYLLNKALQPLPTLFDDRGRRAEHLVDLVEEVLEVAITEEDLWLISTAEVSLTNLVREQIVGEEELPLRYTALTPCFRSEAGASGKDTRGMIRQHQFYKVELVSITSPEQSQAEHERMIECAEQVLKRLELPFRTVLLCTGDMGFSARKTYDIEVWLPSQGMYREISSCSNCGDFQARRLDARCKKGGEKGTRFVHTLNGSGLAVGRTLVALMENYQDERGRIAIPQALHRYLPGLTHIGGEGAA
ncbi:MAG TPA: serine--tRNA ligase [Caulobacteraceae bacterium]|nr:serine--tRNA ligase [Caulobacteraceae bacterium]